MCAYFQPELGYREYYYARNLAKLGHEVNVITSDRIFFIPNWENIARSLGDNISRYRDIGKSEMDGFTINRIPILFEYDRFIIPHGIKKILSSIKPDIVHIIENGFMFSFPAAFYKRSLGYRLIYEIEFSLTPTHLLRNKEYYEYYFVKKPIIKYFVKKADKLNICTDEVCEFFYKHMSGSKEKINRMTLGADPDFFYEDYNERRDLRISMGIADDEVLITTSGKIEPHKRYDVFIKSISSIKNEYPRIKFLIIGSGTESAIKDILDMAQKESIKDNIILKPFAKKEELRKLYNASDIGVWTRATITTLEAIGCGLPVIIPNIQSTKHLVEDGNGLLYEYGDPSQLADRLKYYMLQENRIKAREKALNAFRNKYSYLTLAKQLVNNVYMSVLKNGSTANDLSLRNNIKI